MKKIFFTAAMAAGIISLHSCGNTTAPDKSADAPAAIKKEVKMIKLDLSPIGIAASINAPEGTTVLKEPYSNYIVFSETSVISIDESEKTIQDFKSEAQKNDVVPFIKFLKEEPAGFMYVSDMMGSKVPHFEYCAAAGGVKYRFYDKRVSPAITEEEVATMYESIKTIK